MRSRSLSVLRNAFLITATAGLTAVASPAETHQDSQSGSASSQAQTQRSDKDAAKFIRNSAQHNNLEMALAEVGARKAQDPELKAFSQQLQQDHRQASQQLQPIAQQYGVDVNQPVKGKHERQLNQLQKMSAGAEFDQEYAEMLLRNHQRSINMFESAATRIQAPEVRQYTETMLPKLRQHMQQAATIASNVGVDQSTIASITGRTSGAMGGTSDRDISGGTSGSSDKTQRGAGARELKQGAGSNSD